MKANSIKKQKPTAPSKFEKAYRKKAQHALEVLLWKNRKAIQG